MAVGLGLGLLSRRGVKPEVELKDVVLVLVVDSGEKSMLVDRLRLLPISYSASKLNRSLRQPRMIDQDEWVRSSESGRGRRCW